VIMPGMNGAELRERLRPLCPDLRVVFMSGYTDDVVARQALRDREVHFLQKPFMVETLTAKIRHVLTAGSPS